MPLTVKEAPRGLKPFVAHGLDLEGAGGKNASCICPFCQDETHFSINCATGLYGCYKCQAKGNPIEFVRWLWRTSRDHTSTSDYRELADSRGLLVETVIEWGCARSATTGRWLVPGHGINGVLDQLYQYTRIKDKQVLLATPELGHQLFGVPLFDRDKPTVYVCEGPWDAMAWWETIRRVRAIGEASYTSTTDQGQSLYREANVLGVPGAETFFKSWLPLFEGKDVVLLYDNDHLRKDDSGRVIPPAGFMGMQRASGILKDAAASIRYLCWGDGGYDTELPHGYDIRDVLLGR